MLPFRNFAGFQLTQQRFAVRHYDRSRERVLIVVD